MKILLVEDDESQASHILKSLRQLGHVLDHADNGRDGLFLAVGGPFDVMVIDRMLPQLDGLSLVKSIRAAGIQTPVLFLTAVGGIDDRVEGLGVGGDDYLVKPFVFAELLARLEALARRPPPREQETVLRVGSLEIDLLKRQVTSGERRIDLQPQEFKLLEYLMRHAGQIVTRTMLLENVWDFHFDPQTTVVETHISRLRSKINSDGHAPLIHTVRGAGYCLRPDG